MMAVKRYINQLVRGYHSKLSYLSDVMVRRNNDFIHRRWRNLQTFLERYRHHRRLVVETEAM